MKRLLLYILTLILMTACSSVVSMSGTRMNDLELGMTKEEVTKILGDKYTIAEKRIERGFLVEILSYRDFYKDDEFYLFEFKDNRLEKWHREIVPQYEVLKK